jgi:hypothetical protein
MYLGQNTDYAHTAAIVSKQSLKWFLKASEHDYPVSVFNVAYLYELDSKLELAARWYRRAEALSCDTKGRYISVACMSLIDIIRLRLADAELASLFLSLAVSCSHSLSYSKTTLETKLELRVSYRIQGRSIATVHHVSLCFAVPVDNTSVGACVCHYRATC